MVLQQKKHFLLLKLFQIIALEGMWKSAEVKYTAAIILCDSISLEDVLLVGKEKVGVQDNEHHDFVHRIVDFVRRIKCACALNIAICRYHRGRLADPVVTAAIASGENGPLIDSYVNLTALDFCRLSQR